MPMTPIESHKSLKTPTRIGHQALAGRRESRKRGLRRIPVWAIKLIGTPRLVL
jgi:hypothetical protein